MTLAGRAPIIVADAGPLIRLAAAGLLPSLVVLNRRLVLVDRVADEVAGDLSKPFAPEIAAWIDSQGSAIQHEKTVVGVGIATLRDKQRTSAEDQLLKAGLRDSSELALREFLDRWQPTDAANALVLYEDKRVPNLLLGADYPLTLVTTRTFARMLQAWGLNTKAEAALEAIAGQYDLKPALITTIDPATPEDLRSLPRPLQPGDLR
jgi:hypothetical protein